jgi:hypothetical protein
MKSGGKDASPTPAFRRPPAGGRGQTAGSLLRTVSIPFVGSYHRFTVGFTALTGIMNAVFSTHSRSRVSEP